MTARNIVVTVLGTLGLCAYAWAIDPGALSPSTQHAMAKNARGTTAQPVQPAAARASYIVQGPSYASTVRAVNTIGGEVTHQLRIINAVAATLTSRQHAKLMADHRLTLTSNGSAMVAGTSSPYAVRYTQADDLHAMGITGRGVSIAFVDTGLWATPRAGYDAINNVVTTNIPDGNGHGTHITSVAASANIMADGKYLGVAPGASWITVKAFGADGTGTYANVIRGLDWILASAKTYNIRVVNMSFGAAPQSFYWNDPLAKAVMKLWQAGIVVVASAGNGGPTAQTITVPGNVPYVITVGAMSDNFTPANPADDHLASFSSTGPTYEGFVKPEVLAPGGHITGVMTKNQTIARAHVNFHDSGNYFTMSGTSQAAAVASGVVALMLQAQPYLTPDQVKCKLMSSARPAVEGFGKLAYTVFQQGAGQINAKDAVFNQNDGCANQGLNIASDIAGSRHYMGPARQDAAGKFYVVDANGIQVQQQGFLWNNGYLWNQGYLWNNGNLWNNGYLWNQSFVPSIASASGIEAWVVQE